MTRLLRCIPPENIGAETAGAPPMSQTRNIFNTTGRRTRSGQATKSWAAWWSEYKPTI